MPNEQEFMHLKDLFLCVNLKDWICYYCSLGLAKYTPQPFQYSVCHSTKFLLVLPYNLPLNQNSAEGSLIWRFFNISMNNVIVE